MPSGDAASRFAVQRYRTRLLVARLSMGRPATVDLITLALAVAGAWSVIHQFVPGGNPTLAAVVAVVVALTFLWFRLARRPQDLFTAAAAPSPAPKPCGWRWSTA
jgi:membrane glycosyltransferase